MSESAQAQVGRGKSSMECERLLKALEAMSDVCKSLHEVIEHQAEVLREQAERLEEIRQQGMDADFEI
jgi:hypothetical protein